MPKNQKQKKSADIVTDRHRSELPILDRLLPLDEPSNVDDQAPAATDHLVSSHPGSGAVDRNPAEREPDPTAGELARNVSINAHHLDYEPAVTSRAWGRRFFAAILPATTAVVAAGSLFAPGAAVAQGSADDDLAIKSVRFDVADTDTGSAAYRSMVVTSGGVEHRLEPMAGSARVNITEANAMAMTALVDGQPVSFGSAEFADRVSAAVTSTSVSGYLQLGTADGQPASLDVYYDRPLGPGDHLLIQEGNGDGNIQVTAIDATGTPMGIAVTVGSPYQANTGHHHDPGGSEAAWASVVDVTRFGLGPSTAAGIRISGANVELKAVALVAGGATNAGPAPTAAGTETETDSTTDVGAGETPVYASVGLEAKVQPALAVDGAGCLSSPSSPVGVGQAATFCFLVTNLGTTHLTDIRVTDPQLGLVNAVLPMATGQPTLAPGNQAVLFHHTVAGERSDQVNSIVSARPVDGVGNSITNLIAPTGVGSPGPVGMAATPPAPAQPDTASAGVLTPTGEGSEMVEVPATRAISNEADLSKPPVEASEPAPPQLAMTGVRTEPWIMVLMAMGLIFVGYTAYSAFNGPTRSDEFSGHDQLDFLGFD